MDTTKPLGSWAFRVADATLDDVTIALTLANYPHTGLSEELPVAPDDEVGPVTIWVTDLPENPAETPAGLDGTWSFVPDKDWIEAFRAGIEPITVGPFTIAPPWHAPDGPSLNDPENITLVLEPGMAFGTGHHWTTTACLQALVDLAPLHGRVIDVGCGTGVLSIAARVLGADHVDAVDIDSHAVEITAENVAEHGLDQIDVAVGGPRTVVGTGDVVIANIITHHLAAILDDVIDLVSDTGTLVLCGIGVERSAPFVQKLTEAGFSVDQVDGDEWTRLVGRRTSQ